MNAFEKLLADLSEAKVDFLLVGGMAVAFAGYARATEDMDVLVEASPDNVRRLLGSLENFGEGHARELSIGDFAVEEGAVRIIEEFPLDIFTQMNGYTYEDLLLFTSERRVQDTTIRYLNAEGLIELKKDSLRPKDQLDVQALTEILRRQAGK